MRMRKKKNGEARLAAVSYLLAEKPAEPIDPCGEDDREIYLEVGAGKGGFACEMARIHPGARFYALEKVSDCIVLAAEKAAARASERPGNNLRFIIGGADSLCEWFAPGSVDKIFLNFSDPWSKKGYAKRRLTYRKYLYIYFSLLKDGGELRFKTDNRGLFDFSLEELTAMGLRPDIVTYDLHASEWNDGNIMTEYEENFSSQGIPINMLSVKKPEGYLPGNFFVPDPSSHFPMRSGNSEKQNQ